MWFTTKVSFCNSSNGASMCLMYTLYWFGFVDNMAISFYKRKLKKWEEDNAATKNEEITSNLKHISSSDSEYFVVTSCTFSFFMVFVMKIIVVFHWETHIVN